MILTIFFIFVYVYESLQAAHKKFEQSDNLADYVIIQYLPNTSRCKQGNGVSYEKHILDTEKDFFYY